MGLGLRGVGEQPMIAVAPAIANAVADAVGVDLNTFPLPRNGAAGDQR